MLYEDPVENIDIQKQTLTTSSGKLLKYGSLIIATGCTASRYLSIYRSSPSVICIKIGAGNSIHLLCCVVRFPDKIGGNLSGVHYIRDVADADALVSSLVISYTPLI
jgi:monodehydroascorbate reductase (NADH)